MSTIEQFENITAEILLLKNNGITITDYIPLLRKHSGKHVAENLLNLNSCGLLPLLSALDLNAIFEEQNYLPVVAAQSNYITQEYSLRKIKLYFSKHAKAIVQQMHFVYLKRVGYIILLIEAHTLERKLKHWILS